jgi:lipoic acid synthetase
MSSKHPWWMIKKATPESIIAEMATLLKDLSVNTVCQSALCPNMGECFSHHTATLMIMGKICTRDCTFCAISKGKGVALDTDEPWNVARAVSKLKLNHVVITSVTRDDLPDGGATHFARTINAIRQPSANATIEVLIPDFAGSFSAIKTVVDIFPEVINHNVETVPRLYSEVRPKADFRRSLNLLQTVKQLNKNILTKSGLMVGLGEKNDEVVKVMEELRKVQCDFLTIGQYLAPSPKHHPVARYVTPEEFEEYKMLGEQIGFSYVASGPFVRSSFKAAEMVTSRPRHRMCNMDCEQASNIYAI